MNCFKKMFCCILTIAVFVTTLAASNCVFAAEPLDLTGVWEGWYYANQGQTGLTLTVYEDQTGVFEFYNMPGRSNAKDGSYTIEVSVDDGVYRIVGKEWIERPSSYGFVSLRGSLENGTLKGVVNNSSSWPFELMRNNDNYQEVADSVFNNHKYEVIEEKMYWEDAKNYCESLGGHLVTITSEEEQSYIQNMLKDYEDEDYMIGMHRSLAEFTEWVTGEAVVYENWGYPQPDNLGNRQIVGVICNGNRSGSSYRIDRGQWDDNTNAKYPFICEWETWTESAEWATPELQEAAELNLIPDVLVGKDMTKIVSRGEFAAIAVKLFEKMTGSKAVMSSNCTFRDISENENRNYIFKAYNIGAVNGISDAVYDPEAPITREQLATMLCRVYKRSEWPEWSLEKDEDYTINYSGVPKFSDDNEISDYAKPSVYFMVKYGVLNGIGNNLFAPKNTTSRQQAENYANATREQAIAMSLRSFKNLND